MKAYQIISSDVAAVLWLMKCAKKSATEAQQSVAELRQSLREMGVSDRAKIELCI